MKRIVRPTLGVGFLWVCCCLLGCEIGPEKEVDYDTPQFGTTQSSLMFFKNVRQTSYDREELAANGMMAYRIDERSQAEDHPVLNLVIVNNWKHDEAYVLVEPNEYLEAADTLRVLWEDTVGGGASGAYVFAKGNKEEHFRFAGQLYRSLRRGHQLYLEAFGGENEPLLRRQPEREAFRKTMKDYYRLVGLM